MDNLLFFFKRFEIANKERKNQQNITKRKVGSTWLLIGKGLEDERIFFKLVGGAKLVHLLLFPGGQFS